MALEVGSRLGVFEIMGRLGEGGMGVVYRATDTTLHRDVALKVLPDAFAQDAERLARFQREAQILASLNHPNIAQIHGLEQSGDTRALVLEPVGDIEKAVEKYGYRCLDNAGPLSEPPVVLRRWLSKDGVR